MTQALLKGIELGNATISVQVFTRDTQQKIAEGSISVIYKPNIASVQPTNVPSIVPPLPNQTVTPTNTLQPTRSVLSIITPIEPSIDSQATQSSTIYTPSSTPELNIN